MNITEIITNPELKFRAIHKKMGTTVYFILEDIFQDDVGTCVPCNEDFHLLLSECHVDLWTGDKDKNDKDLYGGDIVYYLGNGKYYIIVWGNTQWRVTNDEGGSPLWDDQPGGFELVGTIYQPDKLPPEVRELLK